MGDNNSKWEPVETTDLKAGDKVRLKHGNGDVIHAEVYTDGLYVDAVFGGHWIERLAEEGYSFERAVPERTLPSEKGWYSAPKPGYSFPDVIGVDEGGWWVYGEGGHRSEPFPDGAVRLVPVTDVEEAEKRIQKVREYVERSASTYIASEPAATILALLDGEAGS